MSPAGSDQETLAKFNLAPKPSPDVLSQSAAPPRNPDVEILARFGLGQTRPNYSTTE